jgi:hypothetical protein
MTQGRTVLKHSRVYIDGYDITGQSRSFGPLVWTYDETDQTCIPDAVKGVLVNQAVTGIGTLNGAMDNTALTGLHVLQSGGAGAIHTLMLLLGIQAAPAAGDPVYIFQGNMVSYQYEAPYVNMAFGMPSSVNTSLAYTKPWGVLLHANGAETAVNTSTGVDDLGAVSSAYGGYLCYQVFAGNGTATIKVQDAATNSNGSFADLSGATSGSIDCATPKYGIVAIGTTATVRRYLRWQIALGTATTVTFALAFVRANAI